MPPRDWPFLQTQFALYLEGDATATRTLFAELLSTLQGYFRARVGRGAEADDLAQTALLKLHFARDRFEPTRASLKTWVFTIASRTLIDHWRGTSAQADIFESATKDGEDDGRPSLDDHPSSAPDPELTALLRGDLEQALGGLKPIDRSIVYLYGVEGMSMAEIAQSLSLTEGATKLRAHRAYVALRKKLE